MKRTHNDGAFPHGELQLGLSKREYIATHFARDLISRLPVAVMTDNPTAPLRAAVFMADVFLQILKDESPLRSEEVKLVLVEGSNNE